jgi:hypothetical protein
MLAENHPILRAKTGFARVERSMKFLLEIIELMSPANNIGSAR